MPGYNEPAEQYLLSRIGQNISDVQRLQRQETEYIVNAARECVAIIGNIEYAPTPPTSSEPSGGFVETGLTGFGIAVRVSSFRDVLDTSLMVQAG